MIEVGKDSLSMRLLTICSLIDPCKTVVDVGSDHGKLGAYCLENHLCEYLVATDIHELPAARTRQHLAEQGLTEKSQVLWTDGLHGVKLSADTTVVIAGMGGLEIRKILTEALDKAPVGLNLVLQPQRSQYELREYLCEHGLQIVEERIAIEKGHYYTALKVIFTGEKYELNDAQRFLGPCILSRKPQLFAEYMAHELQVMKKKALGDERCAEVVKKWEDLL